MRIGPTEAQSRLSKREAQIAGYLVSTDLRIHEIAKILFIEANTVKTHVRKVFVKSDVHSRRELREKLRSMKRYCNGQDPNLRDIDGVIGSCGRIFSDQSSSVICPHEPLPPATTRHYAAGDGYGEPYGQRHGVPFAQTTQLPPMWAVHAPGMQNLWFTYDQGAAHKFASHNAGVVLALPVAADYRSIEGESEAEIMARQIAAEGVPIGAAQLIAANFFGTEEDQLPLIAPDAPMGEGCEASRLVNEKDRCSDPRCGRCWPGILRQ